MKMEENTVQYNMVDTVISNEDTYSWKDLNCVYRPWSTVFKSFGEEYLEGILLLSTFFSIYTERKEKREIPNFPALYQTELQEFFGISMEKVCYTSKHDMVSAIKNAIDKGCPVILPVDLYELSYNPMYLKEHRFKYMIIKGYDLEREIFHILDNIHIDYGSATILTDFTSRFDEMYNMNRSYYEYFHALQDCKAQHLFYLNGENKKKVNAYQTLIFLRLALEDSLNGSLPVIHFEERMADMEISDSCKEDMEELTRSLNLKHVYVETLFLLLSRVYQKEEELLILKEKMVQVNREWDSIRAQVIYHKVRDEISAELRQSIHIRKEQDAKLRKELVQILSHIEDIKPNETNELLGFQVLNSKKAEVIQEGNDIVIRHSNHTTYDTWLMQDYAVQLLLTDINSPMSIETKVDATQNIGDDIHSGIIIKLEDGTRYLFGNYRGERVALFCPNMGEEFELFNRLDFDYNSSKDHKSNHFFKAVYTGHAVDFYCLSKDCSKEECIYHLEIGQQKLTMGLFSKTWEKLNHQVRFYDIHRKDLIQ